MRSLLALIAVLALVCAATQAEEKRRFILYATFVEDTPVELNDGGKWMMDKGDSFPVLMFKDQQTRVVLQLAGATFATESARVKITPGEKVTPEMIANYRKNVQGYIDGQAEKMQKELKTAKKKE